MKIQRKNIYLNIEIIFMVCMVPEYIFNGSFYIKILQKLTGISKENSLIIRVIITVMIFLFAILGVIEISREREKEKEKM
jgi:uncharacterized membrane protein